MSTFDKIGAVATGVFCAVLCLVAVTGFVVAAMGAAARQKKDGGR